MRKKTVIPILLLLFAMNAMAKSLMECTEIDDVDERVACYDAVAGRVEKKLDEKHEGSTSERVEAKNRSITEEVVGRDKSPQQQLTIMRISELVRTRVGRVIYVTDDGRLFRKVSQVPVNFSEDDRVALREGMFGAPFLVNEEGLALKVREIH